MKDSQEFNNNFAGRKILPIKTVEQLVASHLVAEILIEIREEIEEMEKDNLEFLIPKLNENVSERASKLFEKAFSIMKFKPSFVYMVKLGIEDIFKYKFSEDPSVTTVGGGDTAHLQKMFATRFTDLSKINLEDHTLNVFENALNMAEKSGRASTMSLSIIASLFHDFGKSSKIKKELLGEGMQRGTKAHAEISALYLQDLLFLKLYNIIDDGYSITEATERLEFLVKNHHPANKDQKEDLEIAFIVNVDHEARKQEFNSLRSK